MFANLAEVNHLESQRTIKELRARLHYRNIFSPKGELSRANKYTLRRLANPAALVPIFDLPGVRCKCPQSKGPATYLPARSPPPSHEVTSLRSQLRACRAELRKKSSIRNQLWHRNSKRLIHLGRSADEYYICRGNPYS